MHRRIGSTTAVVVTAAVAVIIIGGVATGCSRSSDASATPETTASSTPDTTSAADTTSTSVMTDEEAIVATYQGFWDAWLAANDPPNPNYPGLAQFLDGDALATVRSAVQRSIERQVVLRQPENSISHLLVETLEVDNDSAVLMLCVIDDGLQIDAATGNVLNDAITSSRVRAVLRRNVESWKIIDHEFLVSTPGASGCDQ